MNIRILALFALAALFLSSCKKDLATADDALRIIPATAASVVRIDIPALMEKSDYETFRKTEMYRDALEEARSENPALARVMEDPAASGVDLEQMAYLFMDVNPEKTNEIFNGMLVMLADPRKFEELVGTVGAVTSKGAFRYLLHDNDKIIAWNEEFALYGYSDAFINLVDKAEAVFSTVPEESVVQHKDLRKAMAETHDMSLWFSSTPLAGSPELGMGLSIAEIDEEALKDNFVHGYLDFLDGAIEGKARLFIQAKLAKDLNKLFNDQVTTDFSKYLPEKGISLLMVNSINIRGIDELLSARSQSKGFLEFSIKEYDLTFEDFRESFGGDIALAAVGKEKKIGLFATNVLDETRAARFIESAVEAGVLEKEPGEIYKITKYGNVSGGGRNQFQITFDDGAPRLLIRDGMLFITGDEMWIEKLHSGGFAKGERLKGEMADAISRKLFYGYFDAEALRSLNRETGDLSVRDIDIQADRSEIDLRIRMNDEKTNALKAIFQAAEKQYEKDRPQIQ